VGWLDQFEQHPWYRWVWDRPLFGRRPLTHSARAILGRWPGIVLLCCLCFALGAAAAGGSFVVSGLAAVVFVVAVGHLFV
jgi:hypothetical protein